MIDPNALPQPTFETEALLLHEQPQFDTVEAETHAAVAEEQTAAEAHGSFFEGRGRSLVAGLAAAGMAVGGLVAAPNAVSGEYDSVEANIKKLQAMYKKCAGKENKETSSIIIRAANVKTGDKPRVRKGRHGSGYSTGAEAGKNLSFIWKINKGYKLCGLLKSDSGGMSTAEFPKPTSSNSRGGKYVEPHKYGEGSASEMQVTFVKR